MDGPNWSKRLLWGGVAGLVLGTGPLVLIALLDPKSNPIGPGLLAFFSFWPSVGCVVAGLALRLAGAVAAKRRSATRP